ncbi:MAG: hypothetical protein GY772_31495 [bacterium]|nr:hypothetical protein [bacterium]MDP7073946.1 hypothetical protein [Myxococcota bacterium]MDP7301414.1 hypothetical protein [Myxococcota bacterium]
MTRPIDACARWLRPMIHEGTTQDAPRSRTAALSAESEERILQRNAERCRALGS